MSERPANSRDFSRALASPLLLAVTLVVAYLPCLGGGFMGLDDVWLLRDSPFLNPPRLAGLRSIWFDFGVGTRLALGAEYLPVRDTTSWLLVSAFGLSPLSLRVANLLLYVAAVLFFRAALLATGQRRPVAELAAWLFALHPVHVESVAWLAGSKDVLALLFTSAALAAYARRSAARAWLVPLTLALAFLSKGVAIVAPALLLVTDLLSSRKPDPRPVATSTVLAVLALALHVHVGASVHMVMPPHGGSRLATFWTMGTVSLRYLKLVVWPPSLSLFHDVTEVSSANLTSAIGYAALIAWAAVGFASRRRGDPVPLAAFSFWLVPLIPVSQVLFPLQNVMADRYLLLSIAGPCLWFSSACVGAEPIMGFRTARGVRDVFALLVASAAVMASLGFTFARADLFGDESAICRDAFRKEPGHPGAAYQLAFMLESSGDLEASKLWYRRALATVSRHDSRRMAASNLARLLAREGQLSQAEDVLARAQQSFPDSPQILVNLAEVVARRGRDAEARALFEELIRRFPDYAPGKRRFAARYGQSPIR